MAKKFYAVKTGKVTGIFESWGECKESIDGYPNAQYKGFNEREKAENYLNDVDEEKILLDKAKEDDVLIAYVDGSFSPEINKYSFGLVVITPNGDIYEVAECGNDKDAISSRNVAGEVKGVIHLVNYMNKNLFKEAIIRYDYEGIEKWATKSWKAKSFVAKEYVRFMGNNSKDLKLKFEKIEAHTNDKYNDIADKLAKRALLEGADIRQIKKEGDSYIVIDGVEDINEIKIIVETMVEEYSISCDIKENADKCIFILTSGKDKITITFYINRNRLMVQGHKYNIYSIFISYLGVLVDSPKLIPVLNEYYNLSIEQNQIDHQFIRYLPNIEKEKIDTKKIAVLSQSIFNLNVRGNMYDYTFLVQPILRITEAYIKCIRDVIGSQSIDCCHLFEKNQMNIYNLKDDYKECLVDKNKISHFTKLFNYYQQERHRLFHWDDQSTNLDTTKIITDFKEVARITEKGLDLINEYYGIYK